MKKKDNWRDKYLRALADYQNLEKRVAQEKEEFVKYASENLIKKLLPVLDSLKNALDQQKDKGIELVYKQLWEVLKSEGLEKIEVVGKKFNPETMECVDVVKGKKSQEVVEEVREGFRLKGKVIRVAQVKVGK
jgi:molecular chaperone GrpE